uniref:Uncharacterized protein n=1 Tax=Anguilla anguilla TaxID=7936 RepID=A0A0E9VBJ3_ANGAN
MDLFQGSKKHQMTDEVSKAHSNLTENSRH